MHKWSMPLNSGLIILMILVLARISADLISFRMAALVPATAGKRAAAPPATTPIADDLTGYAPILELGLFGKASQGKLSPIAQQTDGKGAVTPPSDLVLLGTAIGSFRETFALIQKISSKEERVFRLGDQVFDIGQLLAVQKESAELLSAGRRVKIVTPTATAAESGKTAQTGTTPAQGKLASQVGTGNYVIDQRALNAALDNIGQAMTDARLLPSMKDGKVEGFKVSEVRQSGIFGTIGIKNGDVLQRINDFPIDSPEKAIQSFASLKGQSRIKLDLVRDGQPTTFNYDIR